jgi:hypothetical protein
MSNQSIPPLSYSYTPNPTTAYSSNILHPHLHQSIYTSPTNHINQNIITLFTKSPNTNADNYSSPYGIPFECIEFIRRIFSTQANYTFPSIEDAEEMFHKINALHNISTPTYIISLTTYQYPYAITGENPTKNIASYLKPGNLLFWKKKKNQPDLQYGHVAIIIYADEFIVKIAQQNFHPPLQAIHTPDLISDMNSPDSTFLGVKVIPNHLRDLISNRIKHIQVKHIDA